MARKKAPLGRLWSALGKSAAKLTGQLNKNLLERSLEHGTRVGKNARKALTAVSTPAAAPVSHGNGHWSEGHWALGPFAHLHYRLFTPAGISNTRPAPLLVLLHGCRQDTASFAASVRVASIARAEQCMVLMPEQSQHANSQRCWNWFRSEVHVHGEAKLLMSLIDHICRRHPVRRERLYAMGISAGGTMALTLALRFPERFSAVATHSGAVPHSAGNAIQAAHAMQGLTAPDTAMLRTRLAERRLPPLLVLHGDADGVVSYSNAEASAQLWLELLSHPVPAASLPRPVRRGARRPYTVTEWKLARRPYVRLIRIAGLGHAWSGGAAKQAFSDPDGPDALRIAFRFFKQTMAS